MNTVKEEKKIEQSNHHLFIKISMLQLLDFEHTLDTKEKLQETIFHI